MNNKKSEAIVIDDGLISDAIDAIESDEATPEEHEAKQLAKLIPSIRIAKERGDSDEKIRLKLKKIGINLHPKKLAKLIKAATGGAHEH